MLVVTENRIQGHWLQQPVLFWWSNVFDQLSMGFWWYKHSGYLMCNWSIQYRSCSIYRQLWSTNGCLVSGRSTGGLADLCYNLEHQIWLEGLGYIHTSQWAWVQFPVTISTFLFQPYQLEFSIYIDLVCILFQFWYTYMSLNIA